MPAFGRAVGQVGIGLGAHPISLGLLELLIQLRGVEFSQQVAGFDQLKVGDRVDVLYKNALLVKADKVTGKDNGIRKRVDTQVYEPASGGFEAARQIEVLATVQKIDHKNRLVTLRGAYQTQTLEVGPDVDLKDVKVGDTIHAVFVSAAAVQVTPQ